MKRTHLLKVFPQHVIPDELSLLSVYELAMYLLILWGCWTLYKQWNEIPVFEHDITVEALSVSPVSESVITEINYQIPISTTLAASQYYAGVDIGFKTLHAQKKTPHYSSYLDSLKAEYMRRFPDSLSFSGNLFYSSSTEFLPYGKVNYQTKESILMSRYFELADSHIERHGKYNKVTVEAFQNLPSIASSSQHIDINSHSLTNPRFWSKRDISQAYYRIRVHTHSVDSVRLAFQVSGAVEVSPMRNYQPELVTGDRIQYGFVPSVKDNLGVFSTSTGKSIISLDDYYAPNEVLFHIKYKDLENSQSRRVFLITAIISALITVLIAFTIIFIYRVILFMRNSIKKKPSESESAEERVEQQ